ncbi:pyridoxamine 5'-phosphate oxidase family protein [Streptomyces sp. NPDC093252]|uniref:pyridoxamine 5'-phosphate oxidase family protein n=1 Tax=Streptomyces sp. NPDC093252 TaxID=3154980 RepID=UPI0034475166
MPTDDTPAELALATDLLGRIAYGRVAASMRALPFLVPARHIVSDGRVLLRLPGRGGYPQACEGQVVAYGADSLGPLGTPLTDGSDGPDSTDGPGGADGQGGPDGPHGHWSVQIVGACEAAEPTPGELSRLGPAPRVVDGEPYSPVYLRVTPQFATVHSTDDGLRARLGPAGRSQENLHR